MSIDERRDHLLLVTDHLLTVQREWVQSDTPYITEAVETAVDDAIDLWAHGPLPGDCRVLAGYFDRLAERWSEWRAIAAINPDANPVPKQSFWKVLEMIAEEREAKQPQGRKTLESVATLTAQKVPDRQICKIYGWLDAKGNAELWKLEEERLKPGTHVNADYVAPHERARLAAEEARRTSIERIREQQERKVKNLTEPAPESLEDLVRQGLTSKQIARMRKTTVKQVEADCRAAGLDVPPEKYDLQAAVPLDRAPTEAEERIDAARQARRDASEGDANDGDPDDSPGGAMTLEQEIVWHHSQGMAPADIAKNVSGGDQKITVAKVRAVLKRFEEDPAGFDLDGVEAGEAIQA